MAWQETFWAHGFGKVTDKFGVPWMINVVKQQPTHNPPGGPPRTVIEISLTLHPLVTFS